MLIAALIALSELLGLNSGLQAELAGGSLDSEMVCATVAFTDDGEEAWVTDPGNRRILRANVASEAILDRE